MRRGVECLPAHYMPFARADARRVLYKATMVTREIFQVRHPDLRCSNKQVKKSCQDGAWRLKVALGKVKNRIIQTGIDSNYW